MSTPSSEVEYLRAIVADPENDDLRLALAESLRPYEPALSAFIQLQVRRVQSQRRIGVVNTQKESDEEFQLLTRNAAAWSRGPLWYGREVAIPRPRLRFHRGLVAYLTMDAEVFVERGAYVLKLAPIRHVDFAPLRPGVLERLLACEHLAGLDSIGFPGAGLDDEAVAAIADCPRLAGCRYLDLTGNALGPAAFAALAASPYLKDLLVIERAATADPDPAGTWHPGERPMIGFLGGGEPLVLHPVSAEGQVLEATYGELPWLHWGNRVSRFDARWCAEQNLRPVPVPRPQRVSEEVVAAFKNRLRERTRHSDLLPDVLEFGRVYQVDDPTEDRDGEDLRVLAEIGADGRIHLDYFRAGEADSEHTRIRPGGPVENLENYQGQFGFPIMPDREQTKREHEEIKAHNQQVLELLRRKGFEGDVPDGRPASPVTPRPATPVGANLPTCTGCGSPVLELTGQHTRFDSYLLDGSARSGPETAGDWHLACLERSDVGATWRELRLRNLLLRGYREVVEVDGWTVIDRVVGSGQAGGERLALARTGWLLPLAFPAGGRREVEGGLACATEIREFNIQLDHRWASAIQAALTATGSYPLLTVAEALGVHDRLSHLELLRYAGLRFDPELALEWTPRCVMARIYYQIFIDQALVPHLTEPPRR